MKFERTVMGMAVTIGNGMVFFVPDSLGICIQKLQETLDKQERQIHNQKESITTYQKTEKGLEESLVGRKSQIDRQAKTIYDQKAEIAKLTIEVDSRNRAIATYKKTGETNSGLCKLHNYLASDEAEAQRLDIYKAVMEQIRKHVICSTISTDELLRIRQMLV